MRYNICGIYNKKKEQTGMPIPLTHTLTHSVRDVNQFSYDFVWVLDQAQWSLSTTLTEYNTQFVLQKPLSKL